ncbi:MAG: HNH endonuclease [Planctomycetaceae bacterium]|nr:HNH endonuclease [Planctomycetales bacterium]MCB9922431.1 HNH endonuclease [Planctomycetaceae bacterium]
MPQQFVDLSHEVDHIIGEQHRGPTVSENLALACYSCNKNKGPNISSKDPGTVKTVDLFNPRTNAWSEHFRWQVALLIGTTAVGRATVELLKINAVDRVHLRRSLIEEGVFPPNGNREASPEPR